MKEKIEKQAEQIQKTKQVKKPITINYERNKLSVMYFLPLLLIAGFVPLITYAKYVDLTGTTQSLYWTGQQTYLDFFSYWKSRWVMVLTAIALVTYIILYFQKKLPLKNLKQYYIPLGVYALFVIISTMFAIDKPTALWGFVDMYQGMFVLLSYVLITFLTINFVNSERDVKLFAKVFLFLMIVEGIIGVGQYFGHDFFQSELGKKLILPKNLMVENLSFSFGPKTIYGTLFNTNFVGSFATLMLPMSVGLFLASKTLKQRIVTGIAVILMVFVWIGCNSRAGYLGVAVSALFGLWLFRKVIIKHWKISAGLIALLIVILIGLNSVSDGVLFNRIKTLNLSSEIKTIKDNSNIALKFKEIKLGKDTFSITTNYETLYFRIDGEKLYFLDENNKELSISTNGNKITINDPRYDRYIVTIPENYPGVNVYEPWSGKTINFYIKQNNVKLLGSGGRLAEPITSEIYKPLDGLETFMSGRGYIWSRSIPLLKHNLIKGSGADNYPMAFPQDDFIAKLNAGMDSNMVIDKPHNMYLQMGINTGLISLISVLILFIIYTISSLKLYSKTNFDKLSTLLGASCFISVIGYIIAGIFNDYVVSVAPLFWIMLGLGISINIRIKKNIEKQENN